jgi:hypothetical protein
MTRHTLLSKSLLTAAFISTIVAIGASTSGPADASEETCAASDVDYAVVGTLLIKDTQFGAANGVYPLGAGKARVRFETASPGAPATARLMSYELDNRFTVKASFAAWSTTVVTESRTTVANGCDGAARGTLEHGDVVWGTPVDGYRSDGTLACSGNVCGKFGAPPAGSSPLHEAAAVKFSPFHLSPDGATFTMPYTRVSHSDSPRQTAYLALAGRQTRRSCVTSALVCQ